MPDIEKSGHGENILPICQSDSKIQLLSSMTIDYRSEFTVWQ